MSSVVEMKGGCLCGAVRFSAIPKKNEHEACHCNMCRKWSGGPWMAVECVGSVLVEEDSNIGVYRSSKWAERWFCKQCGTVLFYKLRDHDHFGVSVEAFDEPEKFTFTSEIFIDEKPARYDFANDTIKMTGAEVFEAFKNELENGSDENGEASS
jgi:hypothetical protein